VSSLEVAEHAERRSGHELKERKSRVRNACGRSPLTLELR